MSVYVTVAGDPKRGDPDQVREKLQAKYEPDAAAYSIDIAYLPGQGYVVSNASRRAGLDPSVRTDRTGPFKMPPTEDVTEEVRGYLRSQGVTLYP